jgi:hypothetical protein
MKKTYIIDPTQEPINFAEKMNLNIYNKYYTNNIINRLALNTRFVFVIHFEQSPSQKKGIIFSNSKTNIVN